ncbi:MAG TPA: hypothetical protein VGN52_18115 [Burkholderiales bacterium]|jgi:hypothetical protein
MRKRVLAFALGLALGAPLRAILLPGAHDAQSASVAGAADVRCAVHPVKMPCLFVH